MAPWPNTVSSFKALSMCDLQTRLKRVLEQNNKGQLLAELPLFRPQGRDGPPIA